MARPFPCRPALASMIVACFAALAAPAQLRVVNWNITQYGGGQTSDVQTAVYGVFEGRSLSPDIIIAEEFTSAAAVTDFKNILNAAAGSPGDWGAEPYYLGQSDCAFFYRTSKVQPVQAPLLLSYDPNLPQPPRRAVRYLVQLVGYPSPKAVLACYGSHMKAGDTSSDEAKRLTEAIAIRTNAQTVNQNWAFLFGGDMNIYTWQEDPYQYLIGSQANDNGRFFDPISTPGNWHVNSSFKFVHTQAPIGGTGGGMDDRFDQILVSDNLLDGDGLDYIGQFGVPYSTTAWNDANHSYRCWGNDGTSFDQELRTTGNTMVGPAIAQSIKNLAGNGGHCPVFLDLRVPAEVASYTALNFGQVPQGSPAQQTLSVWNDGNVALWNAAGIADLAYTLAASSGFSAPPGSFVDAAGGGGNAHVISMDTATPGVKNGTVTIASNAPDEPTRVVPLTGEVTQAWVTGDMNCDGVVDFNDINPLVVALSDPAAYHAAYPDCHWLNGDCNGDGTVDFDDITCFVALLSE